MLWLLLHAGVGYLARSSDGRGSEIRITADLDDARRFTDAKTARELAARLNARERHHRWRATRLDWARDEGTGR
jgi:hypothetical protein